ncbi:MAG: hypothetical protein ACYC96_13130 [Fimbriimonadaceae bacterium]
MRWVTGALAIGLAIGGTQAVAQKRPTKFVQLPTKIVVHPALPAQRVVLWGYLRTHHPEVLPRALTSVNPKLLAGFGSPALLASMRRAAALNPAAFKLNVGPGGSLPTTERKWSNFGVIVRSIGVGPDASPAKATFADAWDKQVTNAKIQVVPSADGALTATLADPSQPFKIVRLVVYSGTCQSSAGAPAHTPQGAQAALNVRVAQPQIAQTEAVVSRAPFTATVAAGQDVEVDLAFDPVFNLATQGAGFYSDTLRLGQGSTMTSVPLSGKFNGRSIGVLTSFDDYAPQVIVGGDYWAELDNGGRSSFSLTPAPTQYSERIHVSNLGSTAARIALNASGGTQFFNALCDTQNTPFILGVGQSRDVWLTVNIAHYITDPSEIQVVVQESDSLGGSKTVTIPIQIVLPVTMWTVPNTVNATSYTGEFFLWPTGDYVILGSTNLTAGQNGTQLGLFAFHSIGPDVVLPLIWNIAAYQDPTHFVTTAEASGTRPDFASNLPTVIKSGVLLATTNY